MHRSRGYAWRLLGNAACFRHVEQRRRVGGGGQAVTLRASPFDLLAAFGTWLLKHPIDGDRVYGPAGVRYQVARYCEYLAANPWGGGDPLREKAARDGAIAAYRIYLDTFDTPETTIRLILVSLDHFYAFLELEAR